MLLLLLMTIGTSFADETTDDATEKRKAEQLINSLKIERFEAELKKIFKTSDLSEVKDLPTAKNIIYSLRTDIIKFELEELYGEDSGPSNQQLKDLNEKHKQWTKDFNQSLSAATSDEDKLKIAKHSILSLTKYFLEYKFKEFPNISTSSVSDLSKAEKSIASLERKLQKINPSRSCIEDHPFIAETECPFYVHFYSAAEFIGSNEFAETFARGGVHVRSTIGEWEWWTKHRLNLMIDLALTSRVVQTQIGTSIFQTEGVKALEGRMGFMVDLFNPTTNFTGDQSYTATNTIALLADIGFDSVEDLPVGSGAVINGPSDLFQHHFAGIRFYHRGINRFNGAYADIGWGISENFLENESKRFKFRGYLPVLIHEKSQFKLIAMLEVDSDFKDTPDETKFIIGATIDPRAFFNLTPLGWLTKLISGE